MLGFLFDSKTTSPSSQKSSSNHTQYTKTELLNVRDAVSANSSPKTTSLDYQLLPREQFDELAASSGLNSPSQSRRSSKRTASKESARSNRSHRGAGKIQSSEQSPRLSAAEGIGSPGEPGFLQRDPRSAYIHKKAKPPKSARESGQVDTTNQVESSDRQATQFLQQQLAAALAGQPYDERGSKASGNSTGSKASAARMDAPPSAMMASYMSGATTSTDHKSSSTKSKSHSGQSSGQSPKMSPKIIGKKGRKAQPADLEITVTYLTDKNGNQQRAFLDQNGMVLDDSHGVCSDIFDAQAEGTATCKLWKSSISKNNMLLEVWRDQDGNVFHDAGGSLDLIFEACQQVQGQAKKRQSPHNSQQSTTSTTGHYSVSTHRGSGNTASAEYSSTSRGKGSNPSRSSHTSVQSLQSAAQNAANQAYGAYPSIPATSSGMDDGYGNYVQPPAMYFDPYLNAYVMQQPMIPNPYGGMMAAPQGYPGSMPQSGMQQMGSLASSAMVGGPPGMLVADPSYSGTQSAQHGGFPPPPSEISGTTGHMAQLDDVSFSAAGNRMQFANLNNQKGGKQGRNGNEPGSVASNAPETMNQRRGSLYKALSAANRFKPQGRESNNKKSDNSTSNTPGNSTSGSSRLRNSPKYRRAKIREEPPDPARQAEITAMHKDAYERASQGAEAEGVTMMLKNIPNKYTREMLVRRLEEDYKGSMNFLYMPIDFVTECNVGYCFINFRTQAQADSFKVSYNGWHTKKVLPGYNSNKIAEVSPAAVQGLYLNLERLKRSPLLPMLKANEAWQPLLFDVIGNVFPFPCETDKHWAKRPGDEQGAAGGSGDINKRDHAQPPHASASSSRQQNKSGAPPGAIGGMNPRDATHSSTLHSYPTSHKPTRPSAALAALRVSSSCSTTTQQLNQSLSGVGSSASVSGTNKSSRSLSGATQQQQQQTNAFLQNSNASKSNAATTNVLMASPSLHSTLNNSISSLASINLSGGTLAQRRAAQEKLVGVQKEIGKVLAAANQQNGLLLGINNPNLRPTGGTGATTTVQQHHANSTSSSSGGINHINAGTTIVGTTTTAAATPSAKFDYLLLQEQQQKPSGTTSNTTPSSSKSGAKQSNSGKNHNANKDQSHLSGGLKGSSSLNGAVVSTTSHAPNSSQGSSTFSNLAGCGKANLNTYCSDIVRDTTAMEREILLQRTMKDRLRDGKIMAGIQHQHHASSTSGGVISMSNATAHYQPNSGVAMSETGELYEVSHSTGSSSTSKGGNHKGGTAPSSSSSTTTTSQQNIKPVAQKKYHVLDSANGALPFLSTAGTHSSFTLEQSSCGKMMTTTTPTVTNQHKSEILAAHNASHYRQTRIPEQAATSTVTTKAAHNHPPEEVESTDPFTGRKMSLKVPVDHSGRKYSTKEEELRLAMNRLRLAELTAWNPFRPTERGTAEANQEVLDSLQAEVVEKMRKAELEHETEENKEFFADEVPPVSAEINDLQVVDTPAGAPAPEARSEAMEGERPPDGDTTLPSPVEVVAARGTAPNDREAQDETRSLQQDTAIKKPSPCTAALRSSDTTTSETGLVEAAVGENDADADQTTSTIFAEVLAAEPPSDDAEETVFVDQPGANKMAIVARDEKDQQEEKLPSSIKVILPPGVSDDCESTKASVTVVMQAEEDTDADLGTIGRQGEEAEEHLHGAGSSCVLAQNIKRESVAERQDDEEGRSRNNDYQTTSNSSSSSCSDDQNLKATVRSSTTSCRAVDRMNMNLAGGIHLPTSAGAFCVTPCSKNFDCEEDRPEPRTASPVAGSRASKKEGRTSGAMNVSPGSPTVAPMSPGSGPQSNIPYMLRPDANLVSSGNGYDMQLPSMTWDMENDSTPTKPSNKGGNKRDKNTSGNKKGEGNQNHAKGTNKAAMKQQQQMISTTINSSYNEYDNNMLVDNPPSPTVSLSRTISNTTAGRENAVDLSPVSHLVNKAELSPKQQAMTDTVRLNVTKKQIESYLFGKEEAEDEDRGILRKQMDAGGWVPIASLISMKSMYYPGHELMRECIRQSPKLEINEMKDKFRCKDKQERVTFMKKYQQS
ncbi:unnamed protein product [Amoebophrya sp. A120]|nr:unnamed protein product [Amoebophrya sp. A120]|eukprot:GSA120T00022934001.1